MPPNPGILCSGWQRGKGNNSNLNKSAPDMLLNRQEANLEQRATLGQHYSKSQRGRKISHSQWKRKEAKPAL